MTQATWHTGDAITILETLQPDSVDLVLTSPPFLALRSYLPADHPDKRLEGGSQAKPGEYIDWLVDVVEALDRVLAPYGSLCIELGDRYAGGGQGMDAKHQGSDRPKAASHGPGWPFSKSLACIPELFRLTLVYGTNPLTGRQTESWRLRNVIRWVRPNPPVGALGDKFRPATSELMVFCKSAKRYFDLDAVREPYKRAFKPGERVGGRGGIDYDTSDTKSAWVNRADVIRQDRGGAPPLDWWNIPTHPYKGAHYATWPPALCVTPIKAMCPEKVCVTCGEPSRRIVDVDYTEGAVRGFTSDNGTGRGGHQGIPTAQRIVTNTRWSDCGHDTWRPGHVLDPFAGTGTVLTVATGHGRDATGIDLDERNADLARDRVGPLFFNEVTTVP